MGTVSQLATAVEDDEIVFRLSDTEHEPPTSGSGSTSRLASSWAWRKSKADGSCGCRSRLDCLEYLFDVDGTLDARSGQPGRVDGAFGAALVARDARLPGARPGSTRDAGRRRTAAGAGRPHAGGRIELEVWQPDGSPKANRLPLLIAHDGAEMDEYGGLTRYVGALVGTGDLPPMRVALLAPGASATSGTPRTRRTPPRSSRRWCPRLLRRLPERRTGRCCSGQSLGRSPRCTRRGPRRGRSRACSCSPGRSSPRAGPAGVGVRALRGGDRVRGLGARRAAGGARAPPRSR